VLGENLADLLADRLVDLEPGLREYEVRALALGGDGSRCRADTELAGFVACGRHDAALARTADRDRSATELWIVPLLDRRIEGVHVDVDDLARYNSGHLRILIFQKNIVLLQRIAGAYQALPLRLPYNFSAIEVRFDPFSYLRRRVSRG
jgi:hypothetical protein